MTKVAVDALQAVHGTVYTHGPSGTTIYPTSGTTNDYVCECRPVLHSSAAYVQYIASSPRRLALRLTRPHVLACVLADGVTGVVHSCACKARGETSHTIQAIHKRVQAKNAARTRAHRHH